MRYRVFSLDERLALRAANADKLAIDRTPAAERLRYLRKRYFGGRQRPFRRWISLISSASVDDLHRLVETEAALDFTQLSPSGWSDYLTAAMSRRSAEPGPGADLESSAIAAAAAPFLAEATARAEIALNGVRHVTVDKQACLRAFSLHLSGRLSRILAPSVTVLANIHRITAPSPEMASLCASLADPGVRSHTLRATPVLDRLLAECAVRATDAFVELILRLDDDAPLLASSFALAPEVTSIQFGLGDPHQGGRSVALIGFGDVTVVYKPRSMATDIAFNRALAWLQAETRIELRGVSTLDRGSYGWARFVGHTPCEDIGEVRDCYRRIGATLALLFVLGGSDIHFENIICQGAFPHLIDLETLFSPTVWLKDKPLRLRTRVHAGSVLRIGYLPHASDFGGGVMDISGAGMHAPQEGPAYVAYSAVANLDAAGVTARMKFEPQGNSPRLGNEVQPAFRFQADILEGFRAAAGALLKGRKGATLGALLATLRDLPFRWVARPTRSYSQALMASFQPDLMRDYLDRDFAFAQLMPGALLPDGRGEAMLRGEVADLRVGDIPIFHARSDSKDITDSRGTVIEGVFEKTGYETMVERLRKLSPAEIARQERLITLAFDSVETRKATRFDVPVAGAANTDPISEAKRLADYIADTAIVTSGVPHWFAVEPVTAERGVVRIMPNSLYHGAAGIGVFAADLARATGQARFARLAGRCLKAVRMTAAADRRKVGAFDGLAGAVYAELRICRDQGERRHAQLRRRLAHIAKLVSHDVHYDIISGAAGALLVALEAAQDEKLADAAMAAAGAASQRLIEGASWSPEGACWRRDTAAAGLTGFSHGTSGIAYALSRYAAVSGEKRALDAVTGALDYEMSQLDTESGNWPDLRENSHGSGLSWCHGAPGIAFGRQLIKSLGVVDAAKLDDGLQIGLAAVKTRPVLAGACLCHGAFGNAECVEMIGPAGRQLADDLVAGAFSRAADQGAWFGDLKLPQPGLMTGFAGVGHALLRRADTTVAGVLALGGAEPLR